jgi:hypothetical protein
MAPDRRKKGDGHLAKKWPEGGGRAASLGETFGVGKTYVKQARFVVENDPLAAAWEMVETKRGPKANGGKVSTNSDGKRRDRLGSMFGVNEKYVEQARFVLTNDPPAAAEAWDMGSDGTEQRGGARTKGEKQNRKIRFCLHLRSGHSVLTAIADTAAREAVAVGECVQEFLNASPDLAALMKADEAAPAPTSN